MWSKLRPFVFTSAALYFPTAEAMGHPQLAAAASQPAESSAPRQVSSTGDGWPMFRGNPRQTGVADGKLPDDLHLRWKFQAPDFITSTAAIHEGKVYVGCEDGSLFCLDFATGRLRWKYAAAEPVRSSPAVVDDTVLFGDGEGVLHALDASGARVRWKFKTDGEILSSINYVGVPLPGVPQPSAAVSFERALVVFASVDGFVYCLSAAVGKLVWKYEIQGPLQGTPAIAGDLVIAAGCDEFLHVIRLRDGRGIAKISMGAPSGASVAVTGSRAFVGTMGNQVLGVDLLSGKVLWVHEDSDRRFPFMSSCAVTHESVIIGGRDKRVRALDPGTGKLQWLFVTKGRVESSPVVVGDRVLFGSSDGNIYAVSTKTGVERWRFEAGSPISASPAVAHGRLIISTEDGLVHCFGAR